MTVNIKAELHKDIAGAFNVRDELQSLPLAEIQAIQRLLSHNFAVGCLNLTGNVNIGTIIRTSVLFGAREVVVFGRKSFDARSCVGSDKYIDIKFVDCLDRETFELDNRTIVDSIRENYVPILVEQGGKLLPDFDWKSTIGRFPASKTPMLLLGNENRGISKDLQNLIFDEIPYSDKVSIPQRGILRSHNVAVAAGIVMSHMALSMDWSW
jgi:tRNA G18 (ribose-2'-O)-methylase SpoU